MNLSSSLTFLCLHLIGNKTSNADMRQKVRNNDSNLPPDIASSLLEYGIDPDRYQIDPNNPNTLQFKRVR